MVDKAASAYPTNESLAKLSATASTATSMTASYAASAFASNSQASDLAGKVKSANDTVISAVAQLIQQQRRLRLKQIMLVQ